MRTRRIHHLTSTLLLSAACTASPLGTEQGDEAGEGPQIPADACENPAEDPGWGSLDRNSDGALSPEDLEPGEAAVQAIWIDASGTKTVWRQIAQSASIWHGDGNGDLSRYGVWLTLQHPEDLQELYTTAVFEGPVDGIAEPGSFPRLSANWDIAYRERGGSNEDEAGVVELSEVEGELATGSVPAPSGPIQIIDYLRQAPSGDFICVQAIAFRAIDAEFSH